VLIEPNGGYYLLDWDDARLAPPEHDAWSALWAAEGAASVRAFIEGYRDGGGLVPLDRTRFAFYLLRRYLEDTTVTLRQRLHPDADPRDDERQLEGLETGCRARWLRLEADLDLLDDAQR
jgi:spectinomycin phosphotransferase